MFEDYVNGDTLDLDELEDNIFRKTYVNNEFDYPHSRNEETDYENALWVWERHGLFNQFVREQLEFKGYRDWDDCPQDGAFVWIQDLELLMVCPGTMDVCQVEGTFNRDSLYDVVYAHGVVIGSKFIAGNIEMGVK